MVTGSDSVSVLWQLENIGNFITAISRYGVKAHDIFEANDLFENANHTQVQSTLLALASQVRSPHPPIHQVRHPPTSPALAPSTPNPSQVRPS